MDVQPLVDLQIANWMSAGGVALFFYDWIVCADSEIQYIWPARWSIGKVLYFAQRILTAAINVISIYLLVAASTSPRMCELTDNIEVYTSVVLMAIFEATLLIRVYAMYERSRTVLVFLIFVFCLTTGTTTAMFHMIGNKINYLPNPLQGLIDICARECIDCGSIGINIYSPIVLFDLIVAGMTAYHAFTSRSEYPMAPTSALLYRDGFFYFFINCGTAIISICILGLARPAVQQCFLTYQRALTSAMASRLIFNLHEQIALSQEGEVRLVPPTQALKTFSDDGDHHFIQTIRDSNEFKEIDSPDIEKEVHAASSKPRRKELEVLGEGVEWTCEVEARDSDAETLELQWASPHMSSGYSAQSSCC